MIKLYLRDQFIWVFFFVILLGWINLLLYLEVGLANISVKYLNSIAVMLFVIFLLIHYFRIAGKLRRHKFSSYKAASVIQLFEQEQERMHLENARKQAILSVQFQEQSDEQISWIHEIKTPLTAQRLMIDTMPESDKKKELELEWLRIHIALDQTLHILRLKSLENDLIFQQVNLQTILIKEIKAFQNWIMAQGLAIDMDGVQHTVISDSKWLQFIIRQLLSNAIKYSEKGATIIIKSDNSSNKPIYLEIEDSGQGIAAEDIPRVFQRGFTGKMGRSQSASTGMGLYLAKNISDKLGIKIQLQSTINEGTTIRLFFPEPNKIDRLTAR